MVEIQKISPTAQLKGHRAPVLCLAYSQDSYLGPNILASGAEDKTCRLWDLRQLRAIKGITGLEEAVSSVAFAKSRDKPYVYLASGTKVHVYDLRTEGLILAESIKTYAYSDDEINMIDINEDDTCLVTADDQGCVKIVDLENDKLHKKITKTHANICMAVRFRPQKSWEVWSGGMDCKLMHWDISKSSPTKTHDMCEFVAGSERMFNPPFVYSVTASSNGQWLAAGLGDGSIHLFGKKRKAKNLVQGRLNECHSNLVNALSFAPKDGENGHDYLVSGSANGTVSLWKLSESDAGYIGIKEPENAYQLDESVARLNWLEAYSVDSGSLCVAVAGVGANPNQGALNIYSI